jgi:hypothetical protein
MGLLKVAGASQLLMLAAAAAQAPTLPAQQRQPRPSGSVDSQLAGQQQQQAQSAGLGSAATAAAAAAGKHAKVSEQLLKAVALLPDKVRLSFANIWVELLQLLWVWHVHPAVHMLYFLPATQPLALHLLLLPIICLQVKVGFAGIKLMQPAAADASMQALLGLPLLTGSVGAITMGASSCPRPAAVRTGEKLLSLSLAVGPVQLSTAAGVKATSSSSGQADSSRQSVAEFSIKGITAAVDVMRAVEGAGGSSEPPGKRGPLHAGLQQRQQRQQLKVVCSCQVLEQIQLQLHAHQVPDFVHSVQLLQRSLQELKQRRQEAAAAAETAAAAALKPSPEEQERLLPRMGSLSPTLSLSALPRPDTPTLGTPTSNTPHSSMQSPSVAAEAPAAAGGPTSSQLDSAAAATPASPLAVAMQQRLSSFMKGGSTAGDSSLLLEVAAAAGAGVSVGVMDSSAAVITWLTIKQLDASGSLEWLPAATASTSFSFGRKQEVAAPTADAVQLAAVAKLQQLAVRVAASNAAAAGARQAMHQLLLLDAVELRAGSSDSTSTSTTDNAAAAALGPAAPLALDLTVLAGQLALAPSSECLQPLLQLAQQAYFVPSKQRSIARLQPAFSSGVWSIPASPSKPKKKSSKPKAVVVAAVDVVLQSMALTYAAALPVVAEYAKPAAVEATFKGVKSQLRVALGPLQLSMQPQQQQLAASLQRLQFGYETSGPISPSLPAHQSVELLSMQGVEFRRYLRPNLQLLKVATQQIRSDVHIDAALAAAGMADEALQLLAACAQQLQARHAAAMQAAAAQAAAQAGLLAAAAAAAGNISTPAAAPLPINPVERLDSFSFLAAGDLPSPVTPAPQDSAGSPLKLASSVGEVQQQFGGLPPMSRSSCSGALPPQQQQQKPVLALEARLQDVAVQLSVCDRDALQVQLELVKYSSVLEQAVLEKLRFSINERSVVQIPHLALHQLPGWLPPGAAAAAAACSMQRSSSPLFGSSLDAAAGQPPSHMQQQQYDCGASTESIRYFDDGGVQSWQSIDDPVPSASLGSRRPANLKDPALYNRQAARQQAARERCKVPAEAAALNTSSSSSNASSSSSNASSGISFGRSNDGAAAAGSSAAAAAGALLGFEVYAERVLLGIPHDEAPGRIIVVCETWAKAVKPVSAALCR